MSLEDELVELRDSLGRLPVKRDKPGLYNRARKKYGTWNNALISIFGEVTKVYKKDKQDAVNALLDFYKQNKRIPKAMENYALTAMVQRSFGSWNKGLEDVFGKHNQIRNDLNTVWKAVPEFIEKYQRLPLREEFDGINFPHFSAILRSLNCTKWSDIYSKLDISGIKYFANSQHGTGKIFVEDGVVYLSRQEYLIGAWLKERGIKFEKEVPYSNCNYAFDFYLPDKDAYIEYYGLSTKSYLEKIEDKRKHYGKRKVIEIFKHDNTINKLSQEVQRL